MTVWRLFSPGCACPKGFETASGEKEALDFFAAIQQSYPSFKYTFADNLKRGQICLRLAANGIRAQSLFFEFVRERPEHAFQNFRHNLHVKEKPIGILAVPEGLARCETGGSQADGIFRRVKNISVPVIGCK